MNFCVQIDSREKKPLQFPRTLTIASPNAPARSKKTLRASITTQTLTMETGDYRLANHDLLIERKGGLFEVAKNTLTRDRDRFIAQLRRLNDACSHPILFLEGAPSDLLNTKDKEDRLAIDSLQRLCYTHHVRLLVLPCRTHPQRSFAAQWLLREMINYGLHEPRTT